MADAVVRVFFKGYFEIFDFGIFDRGPFYHRQYQTKEDKEMMVMTVFVLMMMLLVGVISAGIRLAWGTAKFLFGLGLFWGCPLLFVLIVLFGGFSHMWLPILIVGLLFGSGFRRI